MGKNLTYSITTNGTLLTDEIVEYFIKYNISTMLSLDGPEKIHDINRRFAVDGSGSFNKILSNLKHIREKYPSFIDSLQINMVVDPQNNYDTINSIYYDYDFFKNMNIHSSIIDDTYSSDKTYFSEDFISKRNYEQFCSLLDYLGYVKGLKLYSLAKEDLTHTVEENKKLLKSIELPDVSSPSGPCIPGARKLFIDVNGNFFPCERVSETSEVMNIGDINNGFDYEKCNKLLNIGNLTQEKCKKCWALNHCTLCAKYADNGDELSGKLKMTHCKGVEDSVELDLLNAILFEEAKTYYR